MPYLMKQLGNTTQFDIMWDTYSLKESTKNKRGKGV